MLNQSPVIVRGSRVRLELVDQAGTIETVEYTLVASQQADLRSSLLDEAAPLGQVLLGHRAGESVPYALGDLKEVRILEVQPGQAGGSRQAAERRRAAVRKAAAQAEITNQMIFATASGSKWGDYEVDVEKLMQDRPEEPDPDPDPPPVDPA